MKKRPARLHAFAVAATVLTLIIQNANCQRPESERVEEYAARKHKWPPSDDEFKPNTPGWRRIHQNRLRQLEEFDDPELTAKWNGYMISVHSALLCQNFTEYGWALTKAPQEILDELRWTLHDGLVSNPPEEPASEEEGYPLFVDIGPDMSDDILDKLKPIHEAWAGVSLRGELAYGLRIYRDGATLDMHVDKSGTHIISSILHVDHDPMGDPWPLVIEDFHGNTNEVVLEQGEMLLYESSKCLHGRPRAFNGAWYSSLFIHYYPTWWDIVKTTDDIMYRIPPSWADIRPPSDDVDPLIVRGTSLLEPECDHNWCALKESKKWSGPVEEGHVLSGEGIEKLDMNRVPVQEPIRQREAKEEL